MTIADTTDLLAFRDRVSCVFVEIERQEGRGYVNNEKWATIRNDAARVLPGEISLTGPAAGTFLRWKGGYDDSVSAGPFLSLLVAIGQGLVGHWLGAAGSFTKFASKAHGLHQSYEAFLAGDECLAACAKIMVIYYAEIVTSSAIDLRCATAARYSDGHGGHLEHFGGSITDRR